MFRLSKLVFLSFTYFFGNIGGYQSRGALHLHVVHKRLLLLHCRDLLPRLLHLRNDLYCVGWCVKLYSLTRPPCVVRRAGGRTVLLNTGPHRPRRYVLGAGFNSLAPALIDRSPAPFPYSVRSDATQSLLGTCDVVHMSTIGPPLRCP